MRKGNIFIKQGRAIYLQSRAKKLKSRKGLYTYKAGEGQYIYKAGKDSTFIKREMGSVSTKQKRGGNTFTKQKYLQIRGKGNISTQQDKGE